ncbi:MAG: hypothetical protein AVDCRST_MAG70-326 [uncultured Thermomicrobiales bacterium]|uniref:Uncharacterized protein n=1 Tax=uncultured Thermomicrobiales bacterium TaxID=1645740 RepID=A0A6J4U8D8_9BACT|nr:MAG: hypothetical protein AVDCRST_MAG70-326 [uncultured Thermomicrobiales bacterium]
MHRLRQAIADLIAPPSRPAGREQDLDRGGDDSVPLTAAEAVVAAEPVVRGHDARAELTQLRSGAIAPSGHSRAWEMVWRLPGRRSTLLATFGPRPASQDGDDDPGDPDDRDGNGGRATACSLGLWDVRIVPFGPRMGGSGGIRAMETPNETTIERQWEQEQRRYPALPRPFIDSPAALAGFAKLGPVNVASVRAPSLSGLVSEDGRAVWELWLAGRIYRLPFATSPFDGLGGPFNPVRLGRPGDPIERMPSR